MKAMGFPLIYKQGSNLVDSLGEHVRLFGTKAFIVADQFIRDSYGKKLADALNKESIETVFVDFSGQTAPSELERLRQISQENACDFVIGFGGGKAQDAAKVVKKEQGIPVVIIPTIASNDAATSRLAITYTEDGKFLGPILLPTNPDAIIVDTSIIINAPVRFFIAGISDALATYFEAFQCNSSGVKNFFNGRQTETAFALAEKCFQLISENAEQAVAAVKNKELTDSVERVIEANVLLSGLGFEGCGVAAAHAISQGFTLIPQLHGNLHGEEVAVGLLSQFVLEERDETFLQSMFDFYRRIGIPNSLRSLGLLEPSNEHYQIIAQFACRDNSRIFNMDKEITIPLVIDALKKTEYLAQEYKN